MTQKVRDRFKPGQPVELDLGVHHFQANFTAPRFSGNKIQYYADLDRALRYVEFCGGGFVVDFTTGAKYETFVASARSTRRIHRKLIPYISKVRPWKSLSPRPGKTLESIQ